MADMAEQLAAARQRIAHEAGQRTGMTCPSWDQLSVHDRERAVLAARNWLRAAEQAGLGVVWTAGPHDPDDVRALGHLLGEVVRALNHATLQGAGKGLAGPGDVDGLVGALVTTVRRLPQLVRQIERYARAHQDGWCVPSGEHAGDRDAVVYWLCMALEHAQLGLEHLTVNLEAAHRYAAMLALDEEQDTKTP